MPLSSLSANRIESNENSLTLSKHLSQPRQSMFSSMIVSKNNFLPGLQTSVNILCTISGCFLPCLSLLPARVLLRVVTKIIYLSMSIPSCVVLKEVVSQKSNYAYCKLFIKEYLYRIHWCLESSDKNNRLLSSISTYLSTYLEDNTLLLCFRAEAFVSK